ncbi:hypothetical protein H4I96_12277 [Botrytis cinerea]
MTSHRSESKATIKVRPPPSFIGGVQDKSWTPTPENWLYGAWYMTHTSQQYYWERTKNFVIQYEPVMNGVWPCTNQELVSLTPLNQPERHLSHISDHVAFLAWGADLQNVDWVVLYSTPLPGATVGLPAQVAIMSRERFGPDNTMVEAIKEALCAAGNSELTKLVDNLRPLSGAQSLNINTSTEIISVANADVIHDEANGNDLNSKPNDVPVESSEGITSSPAHCSILPGGNNGKVTTSSAPENFSTSLESIDTSSLETPIIEHEFSWDFSSDERADALNSLALENPSNVDSMKNPEYGDFEYDFSIHEVPATSSSQDDSRIPKFYPSRKRTHSDLSEKQAQHAQNDLRWRSQSQSYKRPTISTQHHNHSFSREMYEYPESSASFDADCSFDRGSTSHSTTSQTNMNHQSMNRIPQTTQSNRISFTAQSHYMVSSMSSSVTHYEASWRFTSKCFIIISKLQKLLRDSSSLSLDVILATNKSAISELAQMFDSTLASNTARSTSPEDFFSIHSEIQPSNTCDTSLSTDFIPLMVYMIALKCIHDLYSQACFIFTQDDHRSRSLSTPSPRNTPSTSNSPFSNPFGLPQLDFGTFKIDIADQKETIFRNYSKGAWKLPECLYETKELFLDAAG